MRLAYNSNAPDGAAKPDQKENDRNGMSNYLVVIATVTMAIATVLMAIFNCQLVTVTKDMTRATRDMAKAAEAALHTNRPFLLIVDISPEKDDPPFQPSIPSMDFPAPETEHVLTFNITLRNYGNSPADITGYFSEARLFLLTSGAMQSPEVAYNRVEDGRLNDSSIAPGESRQDCIPATISLTPTEYGRMRVDKERIGIHGIVRYRGAPEQEYWSQFFWWYSADDGSCVRAGPKELNDHTYFWTGKCINAGWRLCAAAALVDASVNIGPRGLYPLP